MMTIDIDQLFGQIIADFLNATEHGERPDRQALIAAHPELAEELESFFANHDRMQAAASAALAMHEELDATLPAGSSAAFLSSTKGTKPGRPPRGRIGYFGDYELLAEIARGGMGVVYRARQVNLDRTVALKMILAGQLASADDVRRFYQEAEAAASLEHPGIVPVFEVGQHQQQHFFSMGFVEGPNLAQVLAAGPLPPTEAATIVKLVAEAIAYAHDRGVIHRDLKPANVLLAKVEGQVDHRLQLAVSLPVGNDTNVRAFFQPKVTDFGLAKRTESGVDLTGSGQILGTPSYMSPEQAAGRIADVAAAADVYSLGAILYAALTGHPPFQSDSPANVVLQVLEREPIAPRQLNPGVPRDLDTICLKCLEKDRRKRYASARELADELRQFLQGEPIRARRISGVERAWRWCRRKPALATAWGLLVMLFLMLSIGGPLLAYQEHRGVVIQGRLRDQAEGARKDAENKEQEAEKLRQRAVEETARAQQNLVSSQLLLGQNAKEDGDLAESLSWYLQAYRHSPKDSPIRRSGLNLLGAWSGTIEQTLVHDRPVHVFDVSPDGQTILAGYLKSESRFWNRATGMPQGEVQKHAGDFVSAQFNPDGSFAVTGDWDGAKVWDTKTGRERYPQLDHMVREDTVLGPVLSPDGKTIFTRPAIDEVRLWDAATGKPRGPSQKHGKYVYDLQFSPDSKFALSLSDSGARFWNVENGEPIGMPIEDVSDIAFHPDSAVVAASSKDKVVLREFATGKQLSDLTAPVPLRGVQFDKSGKHVIAHGDTNAYLWRNAAEVEPARVEFAHDFGLFTASFSPDGQFLLAASSRLIQVWRVDSGKIAWRRTTSGNHTFDRTTLLRSARFSPNSQSLLVMTHNETAEVLGIRLGELLVREKKVRRAKFIDGGATLAVGSNLGWLRLRPVRPELPKRLPLSQFPNEGRAVSSIVYSADGELACVIHSKTNAQICRGKNLEPIGEPIKLEGPIVAAALSPDQKLLVTSTEGQRISPALTPPGQLHFWNVETRQPSGEPVPLLKTAYGLRFDQSGRTLHVGDVLIDAQTRAKIPFKHQRLGDSRTVVSLVEWYRDVLPTLRDEKTGDLLQVRMPESNPGGSALLTSDGKRLLTTTLEGASRLWDVESCKPLGPTFQAFGSAQARSPDGRYVVFGDLSTLRIWDTTVGQPRGDALLNEQANSYLAFNPDGSQLATLWHATGRLWDSATGQPLTPIIAQNSTGSSGIQFTPDGTHLLISNSGLQLWQAPLPARDDPERLRLSVEVRTGLAVDDNGASHKLSQSEWLSRKEKLHDLGGPCDRGL